MLPEWSAKSLSTAILITLMLVGCKGRSESVGGKPQQMAPSAVKPGSAEQTEYAAGYALFSKTCRVCHGNEGNGRGSRKGPSLQRSEYTYGRTREAVLESIRNGRPNGMPAYGKVFSQEQLDNLASYVLTLK
jgi:cbb3-type cytochrome c oxidase subunit III